MKFLNFKNCFVLGVSCFVLASPTQAATLVGELPGAVNVDNTGAASYSIPLSLPPGTAGMQPTLSVQYSSQGGNGIMGVGFSLGGLSAVSRAPATRLHDGVVDGVDFDDLDRFVMDGQRLMVIPTNATYGADGTVYRTEIDSFAKITLHGDMNSTSAWFEVHTRSGLIYEYGHTADSFVEPEGRTNALSWAVNKISDTVGNYMLFQYSETAEAPHLLTNIVYTGNDSQSLAPYNQVQFVYENRDDARTGYIAGSKFYATKRLQKIVIEGAVGTVSEYQFNYEYNHQGLSTITSIQQVFGDDTLPKTVFGWSNGIIECAESGFTGGSWGTSDFTFAGDFNGDGKTDVASASSGNMYMKLANGTGFDLVTWPVSNQWGNTDYTWSGDFNGDGLMDFASAQVSVQINRDQVELGLEAASRVYMKFSSGIGFNVVTWTVPSSITYANPNLLWVACSGLWGTKEYTWPGDFNGDGVTDIASASGDKVYVHFSTGTEFNSITSTVSNLWGDSGFTKTGDFNGDGLMDIASASGGNVYMKLSTGSGFNSETWPVSNLWGSSDYTRAGDFNGDGLMDIVSVSGGNAYMKLSTGTNFVSETWAVTNIWGGANATWISDFNGDGLFDIATAKDSNIYINQSTGTGFVQTVYSGKGDFSGATEFRIGDFTGDANMDIISVLKTDICMKQINPSTLNRITKVTKGYRSASAHGAVTQLQYLPITDNSIYEKGTGAVYPVYDVQAPMYVVSALGKDNGAGGEYWSDYTYAEARSHRDRGFLGFRVFESYDRQTQLGQIEILEQAFPWTGSQISSETYYSPDPVNNPTNVQMLKEVRNTWLYDTVQNGTIFPYVAKSVEKKWEFGETDTNNTISEVTSYNWFDSQDTSPDTPNLIQPTNGTPQNIVYGNITKIVMDYGNGAKQISSNSYFSVSTNAWLLGRLSSASVTHQLGTNTITKTSAFDYDATTGLLMEEQVEPGNATLELTTDYQYDGFGNITNKIVSAPGIAARSVQQSDYAAGGRFVSASRNILGHSETYQYDQKTGLVTAKTGPNGLTTSMEYDPLGRAVRETRADGTETTTTYAWDNSVIVTGPDPAHPGSMLSQTSSYKITKQSSGSAPATAWYDKQGREIRQMTLSPSGNKKVCQDTVYNGLGQAVAVSENYFLGETHKFGTSEYDALGRKQYLTTPDGTVTEYVYNGLTNQVVADSDHRTTGEGTPQNQTKTTVQNAQGQTLEVIDNLGNALTYQYDAAGNLIATTDAASNTVEMVYDIRGNKIQQIDPDMGTWSYTYNALGELVSQTDAKNQTLTMEYDTLGRMIKRTTPEGEARWFYDGTDAGCWLGSLRREELRDTNGDLTYRKTYAYDSYGRPMLELYNFDNKWYYTCYRYDQYSRLKFTDRFWRPQSVVESGDNLSPLWNVFTTVNSFNSYGVVTQVSDSTGHTWWKIDARDYDVKGHLLQYTLGNGTITAKSYDADTGNLTAITCRNGSSEANDIQNDLYHLDRLGNLQSRRNLRQILLKEDFVYDGLNRLTQSTVTSSTNSTGSTVAYDATGNILSKTGVGDYTYGQSAGPHAVTSVSTSSTNSTVLTSYTYDLNGNMLGRQVDGSNTLTTVWTSFNKPSTIYSGLNGSTFAYDINNNRIRQIIETDDGLAKTVKKKLYIAGMEQDEQVANPTNAPANWTWEHKETRIFINTPSGTVGICIETPSSLPSAPCSIARKYFHTDHLGSIVAVTGEKIGDTAPLLAEYSYDAWGARRDATTWEPLATRPSTLATDRGFTGHEMLDHLGLVHMNGRIYDPTLGRFLSADPTIQFPGDLQSYNRYTYTNNNPLRYVDPSGYGFFSSIGHFFKKYWKVIVVVVIAIVVTVLTAGALAPYMASWIAWAAGSIAGTFVAGVTGSVLNGGNFGDALRAGLTGVKDSLTDWKSALIALGASYLKSLEWVKYCKMLANGVTTTIISMVQKSVAFVQGMVPEYIDVGKILAAALVGGCASVVGGGKFENGAVTGAFVVLVSAGLQKLGEMHHARNQKNDEFWRSKGLSKGRDDVDIEQFGNLEKGDKGFIEVKAANAHQIGAGNEHNIKITTKPSGPGWWNKFGRHEIILRPNANGLYSVVTDSVNMGTLNYGQNIFSHTLLDVIPYLAYGNVPNPTTSLGLRTGGLLNGNKGYQQASAWGF